MARLAGGDHGVRRAARPLGARAGRVEPEAQRDADRVRGRTQERDGAVDAAAHRDRDAARRRRCREHRRDRVRERVGGERLAGHGRGLEQREADERNARGPGASASTIRSSVQRRAARRRTRRRAPSLRSARAGTFQEASCGQSPSRDPGPGRAVGDDLHLCHTGASAWPAGAPRPGAPAHARLVARCCCSPRTRRRARGSQEPADEGFAEAEADGQEAAPEVDQGAAIGEAGSGENDADARRLSGFGARRAAGKSGGAGDRTHGPDAVVPTSPRLDNHPQGHPRALMTLYRPRCDASAPVVCRMCVGVRGLSSPCPYTETGPMARRPRPVVCVSGPPREDDRRRPTRGAALASPIAEDGTRRPFDALGTGGVVWSRTLGRATFAPLSLRGIGDQLEAVVPRITDVKPALARDLGVVGPSDFDPGVTERGGQRLERCRSNGRATPDGPWRRVGTDPRHRRAARRRRARTSSPHALRAAAASRAPRARAGRRRTRAPPPHSPAARRPERDAAR